MAGRVQPGVDGAARRAERAGAPREILAEQPALVLADVVAPPYDVIDAHERAALVARSPYNVVEIDLPQDPDGGDPYAHAAETLAGWVADGVLVRDPEPALWALEQDYTGPDGRRRTRHALFARVRVEEYGAGRGPAL